MSELESDLVIYEPVSQLKELPIKTELGTSSSVSEPVSRPMGQ